MDRLAKLKRKFWKATPEDLEIFPIEELKELTMRFVMDGRMNEALKTAKILHKRFPETDLIHNLQTANYHLCLSFRNINEIVDGKENNSPTPEQLRQELKEFMMQ